MSARRIVVIGGGLGGLSAAISLATEGHAVVVLEKNATPGGKLNVAEQSGFRFDLGPSILTMPHVFAALFERAGRRMSNYIELTALSTHWRNWFEDGLVFDLCAEAAEQEQELATKLGPDAARGYAEFLEYSHALCKATEAGYFKHGLESLSDITRFYGVGGLSRFDALRSVDQGVRRFVKEPHLVDVLNYFTKYVGSSPYAAPAVLNLLPSVQVGYGLWYVNGGMHALARALERLLVEIGGTIEYGSEVASVVRAARDDLSGVRLRSGAEIPADIVVSNMEVAPFYRLLDADPNHAERYRRFAPSCSGFVMHLGISRTYPELAHHNVFYAKDARRHFSSIYERRELSEDPTIYLVAPCKTDATLAPEGCEIIKVLPHIPHLEDDRVFTAGEFAAFRERVIAKLERMGLPGLGRHIVVERTLTPYDIEALYYSNRGSIYGVVSDRFKNLGFKAPQRSEKYRNLYFVGGSVNPGAGMPMVVLSGQLVRDKIEADLMNGRLAVNA